MKIYKYPIEKKSNVYGDLELELPNVIQYLDVKEQSGVPCIWALVDEDSELKKVEFRIVPTGDHVASGWIFVKTFHQGGFVWHLFITKNRSNNNH